MIGHIVFAISTISIFITVFAIYQRRGLLYNLGTDNPGWSACSFPFVNSAIAAGIYREVSFFTLISPVLLKMLAVFGYKTDLMIITIVVINSFPFSVYAKININYYFQIIYVPSQLTQIFKINLSFIL